MITIAGCTTFYHAEVNFRYLNKIKFVINVCHIEFLEALSNIDINNEEQVNLLKTYLKTEHFSRAALDPVLINYPKQTYKKLVESGMINEFA